MYNILITGGCGFVGSSIALSLKKRYSKFSIYCLDNLKRRGSELNIARLKSNGVEFIHGDIRICQDLNINKKIEINARENFGMLEI